MTEQGNEGSSRGSEFERIQPTPIAPGVRVQGPPRRRMRHLLPVALAGISLVALLTLAGALFWWLAERPPAQPPRVTAPTAPVSKAPVAKTPPVAPPAAADAEATLMSRERAQKLGDELALRREQLEAQGVEHWAAGRDAEARRLAEQGARRFEGRDYAGAADSYRKAIRIADSLLDQAKSVLADALQRGSRALADHRSEAATRAFSLALTVSPDDAAAKKGMRRAQNLDRTLALLRSGRAREQAGDLPAARADYRQALALDDADERARAALARVEEALAAGAFRRSMSEGLAAIGRGDHAAAREAFRAAAKIRPNAPEVADGVAQAEAGLLLAAIAGHRARGEALENDERWREALAEYQAALALDSTLAFAQAGRQRAAPRAELAEQLQFYIDHPQRLSSAGVRAGAEATLAKARAVAEPGAALRRQRDELAGLLAAAQTPVPVQLRSDNKTAVLVNRVGQLGAFESKEIQLLPGRYTAIGRCQGYRDVRRDFSVLAGKPVGPIVIRCEEKI